MRSCIRSVAHRNSFQQTLSNYRDATIPTPTVRTNAYAQLLARTPRFPAAIVEAIGFGSEALARCCAPLAQSGRRFGPGGSARASAGPARSSRSAPRCAPTSTPALASCCAAASRSASRGGHSNLCHWSGTLPDARPPTPGSRRR